MAPTRVVVYLVRHGETDYNSAGIIQGHLNTPLNAKGRLQAQLTGDLLAFDGIGIDAAWSSDLDRTRMTADDLLSRLSPRPPLQLEVRLRERYLGKLQGHRRPKIFDEKEAGCEPSQELLARLLDFWDSLFPPDATSASLISSATSSLTPSILLVSHGASLRTLILGGLAGRGYPYSDSRKVPRRARFGNCCITQIVMTDTQKSGPERWQGEFVDIAYDGHLGGKEIKGTADDVAQPEPNASTKNPALPACRTGAVPPSGAPDHEQKPSDASHGP